MRKIILIFIALLIFLAGCSQNKTQSENNQQIQQCPEVSKPETQPGCTYSPIYNEAGSCIISYDRICSNSQNNQQPVTSAVKEFTIEADDIGLYPETITVNKNDKVKITFKVRQDKVYYGGLDFKSDYFNTGKVLPGSMEVVEFTAQETFNYKSYWPSSSRLKATGTINVL